MKKFLFTITLFTSLAGFAYGHNNPDKKNHADPAAKEKENHAKTTVTPPAKGASPVAKAQKQKIAVPVKKEAAYEVNAPSIFTFTVLSTYFDMPMQKK